MEYPKMYLYRQIVQAKLFIDENFSKAIQISNIAEQASFSKFHFIRLFKKVYGVTPHQYLIAVRIDKAKHLLGGDVTVAQVCAGVGFESVSSFTSLFKRSVSATPASFQQLQRANLADSRREPLKSVPGCFAHRMGWPKISNFEEVR